MENGEWIFPRLDEGRMQQQGGSVESNHHVFSKVIAPFHVVHDHLHGSVGETASVCVNMMLCELFKGSVRHISKWYLSA